MGCGRGCGFMIPAYAAKLGIHERMAWLYVEHSQVCYWACTEQFKHAASYLKEDMESIVLQTPSLLLEDAKVNTGPWCGLTKQHNSVVVVLYNMEKFNFLSSEQVSQGLCRSLGVFAGLCRVLSGSLQVSHGLCRSLQVSQGLCRGLCGRGPSKLQSYWWKVAA